MGWWGYAKREPFLHRFCFIALLLLALMPEDGSKVTQEIPRRAPRCDPPGSERGEAT